MVRKITLSLQTYSTRLLVVRAPWMLLCCSLFLGLLIHSLILFFMPLVLLQTMLYGWRIYWVEGIRIISRNKIKNCFHL